MKKRIPAFLLAAIMGLTVFAGCGSSEPEPAPDAPATSEPAPAATPDPAPAETPAPEATGLKIAIVSSPSGVDDGGFNENNYDGILNFIVEHPSATVQDIREPDQANSVPAVENIVANYDVIVCTGFQFAGISQLALDNPDKKFILVDSFPTEIDGQAEFDNVYAMQFAEQEGGFLAGIAAALETKTGKVAVVNGVAFPSNVNYQFGFMSGVTYANNVFGTTATCVELPSYAGTDVNGVNVGGNYVGAFDDEAGGKVVGEALLAEGCDVILVAAGGSGNGVFTAVKENGNAYAIGGDVDQYDDGVNGDKNIILTSALKKMDVAVERVLNSIDDGTFAGGNFTLDAKTDSVGIVTAEGRQQLSPETIAKLDAVYLLLKDGTVAPAAQFSGTTPTDFVGNATAPAEAPAEEAPAEEAPAEEEAAA
jgi:basic membrane protein A